MLTFCGPAPNRKTITCWQIGSDIIQLPGAFLNTRAKKLPIPIQ